MKKISRNQLVSFLAAVLILLTGCSKNQALETNLSKGTIENAAGSASAEQAEKGNFLNQPEYISVYPVDFHYTEFAEVIIVQKQDEEQDLTEKLETPDETVQPDADTINEPEQDQMPEKADSANDENTYPDISANPEPSFKVDQTEKFLVFRKTTNVAGSVSYDFQIRHQKDGAEAFFTGLMLGGSLSWKEETSLMLPSAEELNKAEWISCEDTGMFAVNRDMVQSIVVDRTVYFANKEKTAIQAQTYDNRGALAEVVLLGNEKPKMFTGRNILNMEWDDSIKPSLPVIPSGTENPLDNGGDEDRIHALEVYADHAETVIFVLGGALAVTLILVTVLLIVLANKKKKQRRRKSKADPVKAAPELISVKDVGMLHNIGKRSGQQDSLGIMDCAAGKLAVVADGMGGLADGDKVSQKIIATVRGDAARVKGGSRGVLYQITAHVNQEVNRMLGPARQYKCGSTLMMTLIEGNRMYWVAVGDSRIYLYRGGRLLQINREHIYQYDLLTRFANGNITFTDAMHDSQINRVSSFIGMGELKHVDGSLEPVELLKGDRVLLMSDGVFNALSDVEIAEIVSQSSSAAEAAARMEQSVLQRNLKNQDNFTCIIQEIQ